MKALRRAQLARHAGAAGRTDCCVAVPDIVWQEQGRHASWTPPSLLTGVRDISHPVHGVLQGASGSNGRDSC